MATDAHRSRRVRFGLTTALPRPSAKAREFAVAVEAAGFDVLTYADHLGPIAAPFAGAAAAGAFTERLHVGTLVLNNDFRHPVDTAREAAGIATATDGRFELGIGAGHMKSEYDAAGIPFDAGGVRVSRLEESAELIRRLLDGDAVDVDGTHYRMHADAGALVAPRTAGLAGSHPKVRRLDSMSVAPETTVTLGNRFATELPELAVRWKAESAPQPRLLVLNEPLAADLGLDVDWLRSADGLGLLTGTLVPAGAEPVAQGYAGHQFGGWVPRLGDGRALLLGELVDGSGRLRDLHLKGSGRTPFARGGDGLAAVGPMLREYVISEAMHALGVPTTRSLSVVATGRPVQRETLLDGAVLARVAASHIRVGSFQYASSAGEVDVLRRLADHAIARHHPAAADAPNPYLALLEAVIDAQAELVAQWMLVGFIHGVMNTDNMTISGETIDYGPCAFMDAFDPATVFSSIDSWGRYAYGNQPTVAGWNLARFAEALLPLIAEDQDQGVALATASLQEFPRHYATAWTAGMRRKLGLSDDVDDAAVGEIADQALEFLGRERVDYTSFFRRLSEAARGEPDPPFGDWVARWRALGPDADAMDHVNPIYIPRNHLVEEALAAATAGDLDPLENLLAAVTSPYTQRSGFERYAEPAPDEFGGCYQTFCGT